MEKWESQINRARSKGVNYIAVNMLTVDEVKVLQSNGYLIEHIGGGIMASEYGSNEYNYLIIWK